MRHVLLIALIALAAPLARAEVSAAAPDGFLVRHALTVGAPPTQVWRALGQIGRWWDDDHTYSGDAANMRMPLRVGACFCETWRAGAVEHGRVIYAAPSEALRLNAALGPLQQMAVTGVLDFTLAEEAGATALTVTYRVVGGSLSGLDAIAPAVDGVIGAQAARLKRLAETGAAD